MANYIMGPYGPTIAPSTKKKTTGSDIAYDLAIKALANAPAAPAVSAPVPRSSGGSGGTPIIVPSGGGSPAAVFAEVPTYTPPAFNVPVPSFNWSPSAGQRDDWLSQARVRAGLVVDPQIQAVNVALQRYLQETMEQRLGYNKQFTDESLAIANIIKNTVKQGIVDSAISRGAETSGELTRQLGEAGRFETEQRLGVEGARNEVLAQLARAELAKQTETSDSLIALEALRGSYEQDFFSQLEAAAREQHFRNIQQDYVNRLQNDLAQQSISEVTYANLLQKLGLEKSYADTSWQQSFSEQQLAAQIAQQQAQQALAEAQFGFQQQQAAAKSAISRVMDTSNMVPFNVGGKTYYIPATTYWNTTQANKGATLGDILSYFQ